MVDCAQLYGFGTLFNAIRLFYDDATVRASEGLPARSTVDLH
jgi:hypothetical protein